jgi:hypothetical protein
MLNSILDIRHLPNSVNLHPDWELGLLLSDFDYVSNENYVPKPLSELEGLKGCDVKISDLELEKSTSMKYLLYETESVKFGGIAVDRYIEATGAHNLLIEFSDSPCFIVGLDREIILVLYKKNSGVVSKLLDLINLKEIFEKQCRLGSTSLLKEDVERLSNSIYVNN